MALLTDRQIHPALPHLSGDQVPPVYIGDPIRNCAYQYPAWSLCIVILESVPALATENGRHGWWYQHG